MSGFAKNVVVLVVSGIVAFGGFVFAHDPGQPTVTCQEREMKPGDSCLIITETRQETLTYEQRAEAQRSKRGRQALGAGIAGTIVFVCAAGYLALTVLAGREKARESARPYEGLRKKLAEDNGWQFVTEDPAISKALPAAVRRDKANARFAEVLRGELDGLRFEVFNHHYERYDAKKGPVDDQNTVILFRHPGLLLDDVSVHPDFVHPSQAARLVLTRGVQDAMRRLGVTHFSLYSGMAVAVKGLVRDHDTAKLLDQMHAFRAVLDELPATALDRSRV